MNIKIVTDSTCDLPDDIIAQYGITVVPCYVNINGKSYLDKIELSRDDFYRLLPDSRPNPTTSAPGTGSFLQTYQRLADEGADAILSIHVAKKLSNVSNVAQLSAAEFSAVPVTVIDSGQLTLGLGLLVREAAQQAARGASPAEIEQHLQEVGTRTFSYAALQTLEYLRRSGRLSDLQHGIASLLDIKPIMKMNQGKPQMEMVRTRKHAIRRVVELVEQLGEIEQFGLVHANARQDAEEIAELLRPFLPAGIPMMISDVTPVLGAHVGPGAVCFSGIAVHPLEEGKSRLSQITDKIRSLAG